MCSKFIIILVSVIVVVSSSDFLKDCGDDVDCMEASFVKQIDEYDEKPIFDVLDGLLTFTKNPGVEVQARSDEGVPERIYRFLSSRDITVKIPTSLNAAGKLITEARSSKLKKFIVPFVVLMILKKSIEVPIYLGIVSILAFKGLAAGLISLVLSAATAFKSLLEHHSSSKVSYEVIPQIASPHWSRSGVDYPNLSSGYHTISQY